MSSQGLNGGEGSGSSDRGLRDPSRRRFLITGASAGGALVLGTQISACAGPRGGASPPNTWQPDACLRITEDEIEILIPHAEMGQGIMTSLAMLVAEELDVELDQIRVSLAPADRSFDHPEWGVQLTGGSSSIRSRFLPMRYAGATARHVLLDAASARLGVPRAQCRTEAGRVFAADGRSLSYTELAAEASALPLPDSVELKPRSEFRLLGKSTARIDIPDKVTGRAQFGIDTRPEGARIAVVARPPSFGGSVRSYDATAALAVPGVERVVRISNGVAVVADSYFSAQQGRRKLEIEWNRGPHGAKSSADIRERYQRLTASPAGSVRDDGNAYAALEDADRVLEATYELPYLAHAPMEPMNACADVRPDGCRVWAPTQSPGAAREVAVAITGLEYEQVSVQPTQMGGGFGRRSEVDFVIDAVETSMAVGAPVQVIWSREDDLQHGFYRPSTHHVLRAAIASGGQPAAWLHRIAGPSVMERVMPILTTALLPNETPRFVKRLASGAAGFMARRTTESPIVEGAEELPYRLPHIRVEHARDEDSFVPVGFWRSVGHSHNGFVVESFIDELAHACKQDPFEFRRERLKDAPRHLQVLERVARAASWGAPVEAGTGRGIAVHASFGSVVAMVADVRVTASAGSRARQIVVDRVFVAVDCGQVVNPDTVEAQIEGALAYGLSSALTPSSIQIEEGGVVQQNFDTYPLLRINQMPEVYTEIVESEDPPSGVGEIATPPIAPAVANAVFDATGVRLRSLPFSLPA